MRQTLERQTILGPCHANCSGRSRKRARARGQNGCRSPDLPTADQRRTEQNSSVIARCSIHWNVYTLALVLTAAKVQTAASGSRKARRYASSRASLSSSCELASRLATRSRNVGSPTWHLTKSGRRPLSGSRYVMRDTAHCFIAWIGNRRCSRPRHRGRAAIMPAMSTTAPRGAAGRNVALRGSMRSGTRAMRRTDAAQGALAVTTPT
jgi:hypothetical protein